MPASKQPSSVPFTRPNISFSDDPVRAAESLIANRSCPSRRRAMPASCLLRLAWNQIAPRQITPPAHRSRKSVLDPELLERIAIASLSIVGHQSAWPPGAECGCRGNLGSRHGLR